MSAPLVEVRLQRVEAGHYRWRDYTIASETWWSCTRWQVYREGRGEVASKETLRDVRTWLAKDWTDREWARIERLAAECDELAGL